MDAKLFEIFRYDDDFLPGAVMFMIRVSLRHLPIEIFVRMIQIILDIYNVQKSDIINRDWTFFAPYHTHMYIVHIHW